MAHSLYLSPVSHGETGPLTSVTSAQETSGVRWNGALRFEAVCFFVVFFFYFYCGIRGPNGENSASSSGSVSAAEVVSQWSVFM